MLFLVAGCLRLSSCEVSKIAIAPGSNDCEIMRVDAGSGFSIQLVCAAAQGFSWRLPDSSFSEKVKIIRQTFKSMQDLPGGDGLQTFIFIATEKGNVIIRFEYVKPFMRPQDIDPPKKCYRILIK